MEFSVAGFDFSKTVKVVVGASEIEFVIHPSVLCARSGWFEARLSGRWNHSDLVVDLKDIDEKVFNEYIRFVYSKGSERLVVDAEDNDDDLKSLVLAHNLADRLSDSKTINSIMDEFTGRYKKKKDLPSAVIVTLVYDECPVHSPLRRFIRDKFVYEGAEAVVDERRDKVPYEFFFDVTREFSKVIEPCNGSERIDDIFDKGVLRENCRRYHMHNNSHPTWECGT